MRLSYSSLPSSTRIASRMRWISISRDEASSSPILRTTDECIRAASGFLFGEPSQGGINEAVRPESRRRNTAGGAQETTCFRSPSWLDLCRQAVRRKCSALRARLRSSGDDVQADSATTRQHEPAGVSRPGRLQERIRSRVLATDGSDH